MKDKSISSKGFGGRGSLEVLELLEVLKVFEVLEVQKVLKVLKVQKNSEGLVGLGDTGDLGHLIGCKSQGGSRSRGQGGGKYSFLNYLHDFMHFFMMKPNFPWKLNLLFQLSNGLSQEVHEAHMVRGPHKSLKQVRKAGRK